MGKNFYWGRVRWALCAVVVSGVAAAGVGLASFGHVPAVKAIQGRKTTDPPTRPTGKFGQDLFMAIGRHDVPMVEDLLKKGGDPNSRNGLEFTLLDIAEAMHANDVVQILLKAGAKPDAPSAYGTPLLFASITGNFDGAMMLLDRGVNVNTVRTDGLTALMMASNVGVTPLVDELLKRKADFKVQDDSGATALSLAARCGSVDVANLLIGAGADVNAADLDGVTPLMEASIKGNTDMVKLLLSKGAKVDAKDGRGRTALVLTATCGDYPDTIKALLSGGANAKATDEKGRTAVNLAGARGYKDSFAVLSGDPTTVADAQEPRAAVSKSLKLIQSSMMEFSRSTTCVSCHQEGIGRITTGEAKNHGFTLDPEVQKVQKARINGMLGALLPLHQQALVNPEAMKQVPLVEINEVSTSDTWILAGKASQNEPANEATAAMAMVLARQQMPDGSWTFGVPRVPLQSSFFTFTALAIESLNVYGPKANKAEIEDRLSKAKAWLLSAKPQNSEDRAYKVLGLKWAHADASDIQKASADILADQHSDGGWSQLPGGKSDAYATGQALYALHSAAGFPTSDPVYKKGVQFLLRTQDDDGSWFVAKRAIPINNYMDGGFPHGESQYASFNGTCYATLALLETLDAKQTLTAKK